MALFKPVTISEGSFIFCRASIAVLLLISLAWQIKWLIIVVFLIMLFSAIFRVSKAPLILLYQYTFDKIKPSKPVIVDEIGIAISHLAGTIFSALCLALLYSPYHFAGWIVTAMFAVLQVSAAFGFCSALKLYHCWANGTCCRFGKFIKNVKDNV